MPRPIHTGFTIPSGAQFGARRASGVPHQGCDYHCPIGTPIYGTGDGGVLTTRSYGVAAGYYIRIDYPGGRQTTDMHLREMSPLPLGAAVDESTVVGYVGLTGNAATADPPGSHDHHEVRLNGRLVNPQDYYGAEPAGGDYTPIPTDDELRQIMSILPAIFLVADPDGAGLNGTTFCLAEDWAYAYTVKDAEAAVAWAAPVFNKGNEGKVYEINNNTANFLLDSLGINKYEFGAIAEAGGGKGVSRNSPVVTAPVVRETTVNFEPVLTAINALPGKVRDRIIAPE